MARAPGKPGAFSCHISCHMYVFFCGNISKILDRSTENETVKTPVYRGKRQKPRFLAVFVLVWVERFELYGMAAKMAE